QLDGAAEKCGRKAASATDENRSLMQMPGVKQIPNSKLQIPNKFQSSVACVNNSETQCFRLSLSKPGN
ncbi:MAG: hypothetical protein WC271_13045, partial [Bacteroidales bacterium]